MSQGPTIQDAREVSILIADDHEIARRCIRSILESEPDLHVVAEASNGREVIEKVIVHAPDVVLMDIGMPEMNGMEATRALHQEFPQIEVLILTMHFSEELLEEATLRGARGYVLKTDTERELIDAIHSVSRHQSYYSPKFRLSPESIRGSAVLNDVQRLSDREREVLQLLAEGRSNREIAQSFTVAVKTIESQRANIMRKLDLHSISELVRYAIRNRIVEP